MLNTEYIFVIAFGLYIIGATIAVMLHSRERACTIMSYGCSAAASLLGLVGALYVILSGPVRIALPRLIPATDLSLFIDGLSAFFIAVISLAALAVSIYSVGYSREYYGRKSIALLGFLYNVFMLSMRSEERRVGK